MRVKLSYSVEEEEVLREAAKMLNLSADDLKESIRLFQASQEELSKTDEDSPNVQVVLETLDSLRKCLLSLDTRAAEVSSVVSAYDDYRREAQRTPEETTDQNDNFGTD